MKKKQALIAAACAVVCVGGLAAGIFFAQKKKNAGGDEMAYVMSVSSMNQMAGIQRLAGVVESQKTLDIQKDGEMRWMLEHPCLHMIPLLQRRSFSRRNWIWRGLPEIWKI